MRRFRSIVVSGTLVAVALTSAFAGPTSRQIRDADNNFKFAARALKAGNVRKARTYYTKALEIIPSFPEAHIGMGHIALGEGRFEDALREYEAARNGYAELGDALFDHELTRYMEAQQQIRDIRDRIRELQRALTLRPALDPHTIEREIVQLEASSQQLESIKAPLRGGIEPPGELSFYAGNALFRLGRVDEAIREWEICTQKSPKFPLVYNNLAVAYIKKSRLHDALQSVALAERMGVVVNPGLKADLERSMTDMAGYSSAASPK